MKLSHRLQNVASFVNKGSNIADIGTDHGYIPIYLIKEEIANSAIAMDIRKGPLSRAKEHVQQYGLEEKIELRLSNGLEQLMPNEADTVIIAGMGGDLIVHILEKGKHILPFIHTLILSPQSELCKVRLYLKEHGFLIIEETMVTEDGKYYTIMKVIRGIIEDKKHIYFKYGKYLIENRNPILFEFLEKEEKQLMNVRKVLKERQTLGANLRLEEIERELKLIKEAKDEMQ